MVRSAITLTLLCCFLHVSGHLYNLLQTNSAAAFSCARDPGAIIDPKPEQYIQSAVGTAASLEIVVANLANLTDVVYILCVDCDNIVLPATAPLVKLVSAHASDECFRQMGAKVHGSKCHRHLVRITLAHKAAVAHALINRFSNIVVLEEDLELHESPDIASIMRQVRSLETTTLGPSLLRFTVFPREETLANGNCRSAECRCRALPTGSTDGSSTKRDRLCVLPSGCPWVQDSSMYALPRSLFLDFIDAPGVVDENVFASFPSILVHPPVVLQKHSESLCRNGTFPADRRLALVDSYMAVCADPVAP